MSTPKKTVETHEEETALNIPVAEKMVTIKIPRMGTKNEEDEVVWVNSSRYLIKKGVPVEVPESVALILEQKDRMLEYISKYEDKVSR